MRSAETAAMTAETHGSDRKLPSRPCSVRRARDRRRADPRRPRRLPATPRRRAAQLAPSPRLARPIRSWSERATSPSCDSGGDEQTAALLDTIDGTVFTLGDNVYPNGTAKQFLECYDPSWGRHKARTRPVPGNHDYRTQGAAGYFGYFGGAAGDPRTRLLRLRPRPWRVLVLNSNCRQIGGCGPGSAQERWLKRTSPRIRGRARSRCGTTRGFSSGEHGDDTDMRAPLEGALRRATRTSSSPATTTPTNASPPRTPQDRRRPGARHPRLRRRHRRPVATTPSGGSTATAKSATTRTTAC